MKQFMFAGLALLATSLLYLSTAIGQDHGSHGHGAADGQKHQVFMPDEAQWKDGPSGLPPGAKFVLLEGDPSTSGYFAIRAKLPAGFKIPLHWHSGQERLTIISGALHLRLSDKPDGGEVLKLPAGSYVSMPPKMRHSAWTEEETVLQLASIGPWDINYVNPSDDPRKASTP